MNQMVRVGVAVIVMHDNKILLGERIGAHGANTWATPGGHLEFGETVEQCAVREVVEETGLNVTNIRKLDFTNDIFSAENKHYITLYVQADYEGGEVINKEPHKCLQWRWCDINDLPAPLFISLKNYLAQNTLPTEY
ncbi:ADP-ribose pyrophosphatase [Pseudoalteromonas sp. S1610]|uniref:nucleotide triphosphate diphosphatase NUDT15 n=1 Tax=unclassified Pseudoalteromonas TaxID=194690 RepID=UPI00110BEABD|nr:MULTISPECIES: NUDIX hydrolase [unclassified Pseudoalteromonas]MCK8129014.1 NUDIX hydrolase [Pseudoalteromonas sp. 2CM39R]TMP61220.1 ADP-ribose pyrophosphatase [Pseudoalteromonas sp. S1610]